MRKTYFKPSEFLLPQLTDSEVLLRKNFRLLSWKSTVDIIDKIQVWIDILNPIRSYCDFPIAVTDGLRLHGRLSSQHRFFAGGACDIRPGLGGDYEYRMETLKTALTLHGGFTRVCYYPKGKLFPNGGFHLDRKADEMQFFINRGDTVNWEWVSKEVFWDAK